MRPLPVRRALLALPLALAAACDARSPAGGTGAAAPRPVPAADALGDTLVALVTAAYDFSRPGVPERLVGLYPAVGPVVSAAAGRVTTTRLDLQAQIGGFWQRVGRNMRDPRFVVGARELTVLGPDAAVLTMTYAIPHRTPAGRPHTLAGAWTAVFQRRDGRWVIVQEHLSDRPLAPPGALPGAPAAPPGG